MTTITSIHANCAHRGECRLWLGALTHHGYPYIHDSKRHQERGYAMRTGRPFVWELGGGVLEPGQVIVMKCGNKLCLTRKHMMVVTRGEARRIAHGRGAYDTLAVKIRCGANGRKQRKLTMEQAQAIRDSDATDTELALRYGVDRQVVRRIRAGTAYVQRLAANASVFALGSAA